MVCQWTLNRQRMELFVVQARPETVHSQRNVAVSKTYVPEEEGKLLFQGVAVGNKIGYGEVNAIEKSRIF